MRYSSALPDTMKESSNQAIQLRHRSFRRLITDVPDFHTTLYTNNKQRLTVNTDHSLNLQLLSEHPF